MLVTKKVTAWKPALHQELVSIDMTAAWFHVSLQTFGMLSFLTSISLRFSYRALIFRHPVWLWLRAFTGTYLALFSHLVELFKMFPSNLVTPLLSLVEFFISSSEEANSSLLSPSCIVSRLEILLSSVN